jgi:hypothetical protein
MPVLPGEPIYPGRSLSLQEVDLKGKDDNKEFLEALEALHFCTMEFMPESEVIQSYCHKNRIAQTWRFKEKIKIAKELGCIECIIRKNVKLIRLSEKGAVAVDEFEQSKSWNIKKHDSASS